MCLYHKIGMYIFYYFLQRGYVEQSGGIGSENADIGSVKKKDPTQHRILNRNISHESRFQYNSYNIKRNIKFCPPNPIYRSLVHPVKQCGSQQHPEAQSFVETSRDLY
eukprot:TRINITY_DN296_c0_g4_i1.p3 TRINITY_DN296_c0_g4~~TRINITY_DN296_c0_g4_i1.p3  ORF type:complete len:108 (-),score=4.12 TRINITY_DN296_c0_g4_i1:340-663(-)